LPPNRHIGKTETKSAAIARSIAGRISSPQGKLDSVDKLHFRFSLTFMNTAPVTDLLCHYRNSSPTVQVIRVDQGTATGEPLERVVFPSQTLLFHGQAGHTLSVYQGDTIGQAQLVEQVPCDRLQVLTE
jgi:hypothetical protein